MQIDARRGRISDLSRGSHVLAWLAGQGRLCEAKIRNKLSCEAEAGSMKGCPILAELLESGKHQFWGGNGPTPPQPVEDLLLVPTLWGGTILPSFGWEEPGTGSTKGAISLGYQPSVPSRKELT